MSGEGGLQGDNLLAGFQDGEGALGFGFAGMDREPMAPWVGHLGISESEDRQEIVGGADDVDAEPEQLVDVVTESAVCGVDSQAQSAVLFVLAVGDEQRRGTASPRTIYNRTGDLVVGPAGFEPTPQHYVYCAPPLSYGPQMLLQHHDMYHTIIACHPIQWS